MADRPHGEAPPSAELDNGSDTGGTASERGVDEQEGNGPATLGARLRHYRQERRLSLSELAIAANVSKGYLSSLEDEDELKRPRRPSAEIMYRLARALGVTMADLMGRRLLTAARPNVPESLTQFADEANLSEADLSMLATIQFRGEQPRTSARWRYIYDSIRNSAQMDRDAPDVSDRQSL